MTKNLDRPEILMDALNLHHYQIDDAVFEITIVACFEKSLANMQLLILNNRFPEKSIRYKILDDNSDQLNEENILINITLMKGLLPIDNDYLNTINLIKNDLYKLEQYSVKRLGEDIVC